MPHLYTFHFDIVTEYVSINEQQPKSTPDDIRPTFTERGYHVDCYIDYEFYNSGRCHVYSLPFHTKRICHIMHSFAGGMFTNVRVLRMKDDFYPFEHKFFAQISRSFRLLSRLMVSNAAFLLPIISNLIEYYSNELHDKHDPPSPLCLILSPTRELALQTEREARKFAYQTAVILSQHFIRSNYIFLVVGKPDATNEDIAQTIEEVPNAFKKDHLFQLLEQNLKSERCLIFVETN
ncbi:unnamed protein product [Rotaria sp. Silwood1]|nr:unnamed protein product [Rotaria sp. Silwood1]